MTTMLACALLLGSCQGGKASGDVVARAFDSYLKAGDLVSVVTEGMSQEDSLNAVNNYIDQWLQQQVVLHKAEKNVDKDFQEELQNYKKSLLIYEYERQVIAQMLDTNIDDEEVKRYYEGHHDDFLLKSNIVRAIYVKVPAKAPCIARLRVLMSRAELSDDEYQELQKLAGMYGEDYNFDEEQWMPFQKLQAAVPIDVYNEVAFLQNNRSYITQDDGHFYALRILEYKVTDQVSPLEYQYNQIRTVLLNRRKIDIIRNMQLDLLRKAEMNKDIERYK